MADPIKALPCFNCGSTPTHFCASCGKWICDSKRCALIAAGKSIAADPVKAIKAAPAFIRQQVRTFLPPIPGGRN